MPEMKGIIPGSFYQLFGEEQHLGSRCLIIWGAQREHCVRGQICSVAGSIWWWDAYLGANEMPGGVTVICYHPPPPTPDPPTTDITRLFMRGAEPGDWLHIRSEGQDEGSRGRHPPSQACSSSPATHTCVHTLVHTRRNEGKSGKLPHTVSNHAQLS